MKKLAIGIITIGALIGTPVLAADLNKPVYKAPPTPPPPPIYSWTGCYVGGNVGWIGSDNHYDLSMAGGFLDPINLFSNPEVSGPLNHSYDPHDSAVTGGGQVGCNYQTGAVVVGAEVDFNGSGLRDSINASYGPVTLPEPAGTANAHTESVNTDLDWFSTFRVRLGFTPAPQWLVYATGGGAVAHFRSTANLNFASTTDTLTGDIFNGSDTVTRLGWTAGGGVEYAFGNNWSLRAEYLFLDFGSRDYLAVCSTAVCIADQAPGQAPFAWNVHTQMRANIARVALNYKFN
jgi:outer membrane immunogenic protein